MGLGSLLGRGYNAALGIVHDEANGVDHAVGQALDITHVGDVASAGVHALRDVAGAIKDVTAPILGPIANVDRGIYDRASQALTYDVSGIMGHPVSADEARKISPGRAFVSGVAQDFNLAGKYTGINAGLEAIGSPYGIHNLGDVALTALDPLHVEGLTHLNDQLVDPNFDITDETQANRVFGSGAGKFLSGVTDGVVSWNLDPLAVGGKVAAGVRAAKYTVEGVTRRATKGLAGDAASEAAQAAVRRAAPVQHLAATLAAEPAGQRGATLARNPTTRAVPGVNYLLNQAEDLGQIQRTLAVVTDASQANINRLVNENKKIADEAMELKTTQLHGLQAELDAYPLLPEGGDYPPWVATRNAERHAEISAELDRLNQRIADADRTHDLNDQMLNIVQRGGMQALPRVTVGNRLVQASGWVNFQPGRLAVPARILKAGTSWKPEIVDFSVPGDDVKQMTRMLDRAGHAFPLLGKRANTGLQRAGITSQGIDPAVKNALISKLMNARTVDERAAVLHEGEQTVLRHYAHLAGVTDLDKAQALVDEFDRRRAKIGHATISGSPDPSFSGTPKPGAPGRTLDEYLDPDNQWGRGPLVDTDMANKYPLIPVDKIAKVMQQEAWAFRGDQNPARLIAAMRGQDKYTDMTTAGLDHVMGKITTLLTSAQLMRLGYIARNVTDQSLRMYAVLGATTAMPLQGASILNAIKAGKAGMRTEDWLSKAARADALKEVERLTGMKAVGLERQGMVDQLHAYDQRIHALQPHIDGEGAKLKAMGDMSQGERVYVSAPARSPLKPGPRGMRYSTTPITPATAGHEVHERIVDTHWRKTFDTDAGYADPGIAALSEFTNEARFGELGAMSTAKLRETILGDFPDVKLGSLRSRDELLSAYGAQMAKRRGYEAIRHEGLDGTHLVDLTGTAVRKGADEAAMVASADRLQYLRDQQAVLRMHRGNLAGKIDLTPEFTDFHNTELGRYTDQAMSMKERRALYGKELPFQNHDVRIVTPSGQVLHLNGPFKGAHGRMSYDATSSVPAHRSLVGAQYKYVNGLRVQAGDVQTISPTGHLKRAGADADRYESSYAKGWEKAANQQLGGSPVASRMLQGQDDEQILDWLNNTPAGRDLRANRPGRNNNLDDWLHEVRLQVDTYLPGEAGDELRRAAAEGNATYALLKKMIPNPAARPMVHGESLDHAVGDIPNPLRDVRDFFFESIAGATTDRLTNSPYFAGVYQHELKQAVERLRLSGTDTVSESQREAIHYGARRRAEESTKRTMYDLTQRSNLASTMRFMAPFYTAWQEALVSWSRLFMEDPSRFERLMQLYQAPSKAGYVHTDANGNKSITMPIPKSLRDSLPGLTNADMPLNVFTGSIAQGGYWFLPGAGAPITVPVSALARRKPALASALEPIIPFGPGKDVLDSLLPADVRRLRTAWSTKDDDPQFADTLVRNYIDLEHERNQGMNKMTDTQLRAEAERRATSFWALRGLSNALYPAAPTAFKDPKYQMYYDQAGSLRQQYAQYQQRTLADGTHRNAGEDDGGKRWEEAFIDKFGKDYYEFTASTSKSNIGNVAPTKEGYHAIQKYKSLIAENPDLGKLIVGDEDKGAYDPNIQAWQQSNEIAQGQGENMRTAKTPEEAAADAQTQLGWDAYRKFNTAITTVLSSRGLKSITAAGATDLRAAKDAFVANNEVNYPAWKAAYGTFSSGKPEKTISVMEEALNNPDIAKRDGWRTVAEYLAARKNWVAVLADRKAHGGSANLQAAGAGGDNSDLAQAWDTYVGGLVESDPAFADIYYRYLENDKMITGGV